MLQGWGAVMHPEIPAKAECPEEDCRVCFCAIGAVWFEQQPPATTFGQPTSVHHKMISTTQIYGMLVDHRAIMY